jgi:hypothetical protein
MTESTPSRRRWFQFGLRTLLILVAVVAVLLGWITNERRQSRHEQEIAEQLRHGDGWLMVTLGVPYDPMKLPIRHRFSTTSHVQEHPKVWWRALAARIFGKRILAIEVSRSIGVDDLSPLVGLTNLELVYLGATSIKDLSPLAFSPNLRVLHIGGTQVSDVGPLATLKQLEELDLTDTSVRDLAPLFGLTTLQRLYLRGAPIPKEQIDALQKALPNCSIDPRYGNLEPFRPRAPLLQ